MKMFNTFLYFEISLTLFSSIIVTSKLDLGVCTEGTQVSCCSNYYEVNNKCIECQSGKFGKNCSQSCLYGFYGALCRSKCDCKASEVCDPKVGCKDRKAYCGEDTCCINYISIGGVCKACPPGSYDVNCTKDCPNGTYGLFCKEKCTCTTGCDRVIGCNVSESDALTTSEILIFTLAPIIPATMIGLSVFFLGKYIQRNCKKKRTSSRNFADIPPFDNRPLRMHDSNGEIQNNLPNERYSALKTEVEETRLPGIRQEEKFDDGVYHTLNLRVTRYEEPVTRKHLTRRYSDSSSTYIKRSSCNLKRFEEEGKNRRCSSLRIKDINGRDNGDKTRLQNMEAGEGNVSVSSTKGDESFSSGTDRENIYDTASFEEHDETVNLNNRQLFLKELSSKLLNHK